jgi:hypothetical protein
MRSVAETNHTGSHDQSRKRPCDRRQQSSNDWVANVKKYVRNADHAAIHGMVEHLGIALRGKDSSFVAYTDKAEHDLVRAHFYEEMRSDLRRTMPNSIAALPMCVRRCVATATSLGSRSITCSPGDSASPACSIEWLRCRRRATPAKSLSNANQEIPSCPSSVGCFSA